MARRLAPGKDHALEERNTSVRQEQVGVHVLPSPEPPALVARTIGRVERELARLELGQARTAVGTGVVLAEEMGDACPTLTLHHLQNPVGGSQGRLHRVGEPSPVLLLDHKAVHYDGDVVVLVATQPRRLPEIDSLPVNDGPDEALLTKPLEELTELALPSTDQRGKYLDLGALLEREKALDDLRGGLPNHGPAALWTVGHPDSGPQEPQVVVDFGDGPDRGPGIPADGLLLDGDGRREPLDGVDVGFFHETQELSRVGRKRLYVASLSFGVDRVEGQRRLTGPRESGDHDQSPAGEFHVDVPEVVFPGTADNQGFSSHSLVGYQRLGFGSKGGVGAFPSPGGRT